MDNHLPKSVKWLVQLHVLLWDTSICLRKNDVAIAIECHGMASRRSEETQYADDAVWDQTY